MVTYNPSRVLYGADAKMLFAESAVGQRLGNHALIVTNEDLVRDGTVPVLRAGLEDVGVSTIIFDRVGESTASDAVEEVASLASGGHADFVVGVGSSVILDFARIVSLASGSDKHVYRLIDEPVNSKTKEGLPLLAVPTRCWNPLLFSELAIITDAREGTAKPVHTAAYPDTVYYLSRLCENLTGKQAVYDLLCIFSDCVEAMDKAGGTVGYPLVLDAIEQVVSILRSIPTSDTPPDRGRIRVAGIHSAWFSAFPSAGFALGRSAHSRTGVSPEWVAAALLPEITGYRSGENPELAWKLQHILGLEGTDNQRDEAEEVEMEVRSLTALADVPLRLRDLGVSLEGLAAIAGPAAGICDIEEETLLNLLKTAL